MSPDPISPIASRRERVTQPRLAAALCGLELASPVVLAAGTAGVLDEMAEVCDLSKIGAVITKSITPEPRGGNRPWRISGTTAGMLNAIGLANPGIDAFEAEHAPRAGGLPCRVIGSAAGFSVEDYVRVCARFEDMPGIDAVELNVSCPNVAHGTEFGADPVLLAELVSAVRPVLASKPMLVKLSPVAVGTPATIVDLARAAIEPRSLGCAGGGGGPSSREGCDGLSLCNTVPAMAVDVDTRRPVISNVSCGLSGPAVHPVVVRLVHLVYRGIARDAGVSILGTGGVSTWRDAAELVLVGASAVAVGTASFIDPRAGERIARGLLRWAGRQGVSGVEQLVGAVRIDGGG